MKKYLLFLILILLPSIATAWENPDTMPPEGPYVVVPLDEDSWERVLKYGEDGSTKVIPGMDWYFDSGGTVVDKEFSDQVLYGAVVTDVWQQAIQDGRAFRARTTFTLDSGETRFFYAATSGDTVEIQLRVDAYSNAETEYTVWLEPRVSGGSSLRSGSLNPHIQAIGGYQSQYGGVFYDPSSVTTYGMLISDATERWGSGGKSGGTSSDKPSTILSPNQVLGFQFCSFFNGNIIHVEFIWKETPGGIEE